MCPWHSQALECPCYKLLDETDRSATDSYTWSKIIIFINPCQFMHLLHHNIMNIIFLINQIIFLRLPLQKYFWFRYSYHVYMSSCLYSTYHPCYFLHISSLDIILAISFTYNICYFLFTLYKLSLHQCEVATCHCKHHELLLHVIFNYFITNSYSW